MVRKLNLHKYLFLAPFLLAGFFSLVYAYYSLYRHLSFDSHAFDLGIHTQAIYLYSQGLTPFSTLKQMVILGDHFGVILILLSPLYKLFPSANTLLVIQSLFVGLSSIPIYLIARHKLKGELLSFLITLGYLTSTGILAAIRFDFHLGTISVLPLSLVLHAWYFQKWRLYWLSLFFAILFKEDVLIFILGLGVFEVLQRQAKIGIITAIFSLACFYLIKFQVMPYFHPGSENGYISTSILPLTSPVDFLGLIIIRPFVLVDIFFNSPVKMLTFDTLYKQFAFLPILSPLSWLAVFPSLYLRFSSTLPHFWNTNWHYNANLEPFLAVSSILAIARFKLPKFPVAILLSFFIITGGLAPNRMIWSTLQLDLRNTFHRSYINDSLVIIPSSASVSAQSPLVPHLANREKIYMFPEVSDAEYIVLDRSLSSYPIEAKSLQKEISNLRNSRFWQVAQEKQTLTVFKRGGTGVTK